MLEITTEEALVVESGPVTVLELGKWWDWEWVAVKAQD